MMSPIEIINNLLLIVIPLLIGNFIEKIFYLLKQSFQHTCWLIFCFRFMKTHLCEI